VVVESLNKVCSAHEVTFGDLLKMWRFHIYFSKAVPERVSDVQHISQTNGNDLETAEGIQEKVETMPGGGTAAG